MSGQDFEDRVLDTLEEWVGDDGVVMARKQSFSFRRGSFQASQEVDIMVDSSDDDFYLGLEAKSRDVSTDNGSGMYYSSDYKPDQFEKQEDFRDKSGRQVGIIVELVNYRDNDSCVYLCPIELFTEQYRADRKKTTWDQIAAVGVYLGSGDDFEFKKQDWTEMHHRAEEILDDVESVDRAVEDAEEHDAWYIGS